MVNAKLENRTHVGTATRGLIALYVIVVVATLLVLAGLTATRSPQATTEAWVHAIIVGVFAVVLPLRLRAAVRGSARAHRAIGIIAVVLLVVNVVEAVIPGLFPVWMRIEMVGIAVLMAAVVVAVTRDRRAVAGS